MAVGGESFQQTTGLLLLNRKYHQFLHSRRGDHVVVPTYVRTQHFAGVAKGSNIRTTSFLRRILPPSYWGVYLVLITHPSSYTRNTYTIKSIFKWQRG